MTLAAGTAVYDLETNADTYADLGVRELWLIDQTQETIEIRTLTEDGFDSGEALDKAESIRSTVLPELDFAVAELFRN